MSLLTDDQLVEVLRDRALAVAPALHWEPESVLRSGRRRHRVRLAVQGTAGVLVVATAGMTAAEVATPDRDLLGFSVAAAPAPEDVIGALANGGSVTLPLGYTTWAAELDNLVALDGTAHSLAFVGVDAGGDICAVVTATDVSYGVMSCASPSAVADQGLTFEVRTAERTDTAWVVPDARRAADGSWAFLRPDEGWASVAPNLWVQIPAYPTNDAGWTFGETVLEAYAPDLVLVDADDGATQGYVNREALRDARRDGGYLPVYASDGVTEAGWLTVRGSDPLTGD